PRRAARGRASATSGASRSRGRSAGAAPAPRRGRDPSVGEAEDALGDDVQLDLGRAALDRVAAGAKPVARRAQLVVAEAGAFPPEALWPEHLDHERAPPLVQLRPVVLEDRRLGTRGTPGLRPVARTGERQVEARLVHLD